MMRKTLLASGLAAAFILVGCGGGSSDTISSTTTDTIGYVVDSAVANLNYDCIADNDYNKTTSTVGAFTCRNMNQVRFRLGNLVLGEISALPQDGYVFPQDMVGVPRDSGIYDAKVTAIAQLLQSCDVDDNLTNGIEIDPVLVQDFLDINETFDVNSSDTYLGIASQNQHRIRTQTEAQAHLQETLQTINTATAAMTAAGTKLDVFSMEMSTLSDTVKNTIEWMENDEKLAYDIYTNLYTYHLANGTTLFQFTNIAERSETVHEQLVEDLAVKYNITLVKDLPSGEFSLPETKAIYDTLYTKGITSAQDALEVGCMVEVTDILDLDRDIALAEADNDADVVAVYNVLRDGSYNHYWSFDAGLKNMGVTDGCCSLGTIDGVNYCHPEYPQNPHGNQ